MTAHQTGRASDARHCGNCGASDLAIRLSDRGKVARVACRGCGARGRVCSGESRDAAIAAAITAWNHSPPTLPAPEEAAPALAAPQRRARRIVSPHTDERDVLELVARMLVPGGYRVPVAGRSSRPSLQPSDVAAALGTMRGRLERDTAMAVVTRANSREIAQLSSRAFRRALVHVGRLRPCPLDLDQGQDRWRLRLVLYDAAHALVWPEWQGRAGEAAQRAKMRKSVYLEVHRVCVAVLQEALSDARRQFGRRLFAD